MSDCFLYDKSICPNSFQPGVAFHIETSHFFCRIKQMTGFYVECNTGWNGLIIKYYPALPCFINSFFTRFLRTKCLQESPNKHLLVQSQQYKHKKLNNKIKQNDGIYLNLMSLWLTLNIFHIFIFIYCCLGADICLLGYVSKSMFNPLLRNAVKWPDKL